MKAGFVGLGTMGAHMARNLHRATLIAQGHGDEDISSIFRLKTALFHQ